MATYYVNLSSNSNLGSSGTEGSPFGWLEVKTKLNSDEWNNEYFLKGSRTDLSFSFINKNSTFKSWLSNDIWRLKIDSISTSSSFDNDFIINNGLLELNSFSSANQKNCCLILYSTLAKISNINIAETSEKKVIKIIGSTLVCSDFQGPIIDFCYLYFQDSIIDINSKNFSNSKQGSYFTGCVFKGLDWGINFSNTNKTNCQFSYTPPTWPAFDASRSSFNASNLSVGINTPPLPGYEYPTFMNYNTGLYLDKNRLGIGGMDF